MFFFGDAYFGRVDWVPGMFYVKTRFLHVWWVPLVPRESWVVEDDGQGKHGHRIHLSWKSVFVAWSRVALGFLFIFAGLFLVASLGADPKQMTVHPIVTAGIFLSVMAMLAGAYALTYRWAKPCERRAFELAKWMGADPSEVANRFPLSQSTGKSEGGYDP